MRALFLVAAGVCSTVAMAAAPAEAMSFKEAIVPVLKSKCAACHLTGQEPGKLALHPGAAYASLVDVKSTESAFMRVKPGAPDESYLVMKLEGTHLAKGGQGTRMPFGGAPLDADTLAIIRQWISAGALNN